MLHAGERFEVRVDLEASKPTRIEGVEVVLRQCVDRGQDGVAKFVEAQAIDLEGATVERETLRVQMALGPDALPTLQHLYFSRSYELTCTVKLPWRFDPIDERTLVVEAPPIPRPAPIPVATTGTLRGAVELGVEVVLDDAAVAPGESVTGRASFHGRGSAPLEGALFGIVQSFEGTATVATEVALVTTLRDVERARDGDVIPFSLRIPKGSTASYASAGERVEHAFVLRVDGFEGRVRVPICVGNFSEGSKSEGAAIAIGIERWLLQWSDIGVRHELRSDSKRLRLEGRIAPGTDLEVWCGDSVFVEAELSFRALGVGLRIAPKMSEEASPASYRVTAFDPLQGEALATPGVRAAITELRASVTVDDSHARVRTSFGGGDAGAIEALIGRMKRLANELAVAVSNLPPPAPVGDAGPAWRAFRERYGGQLNLGELSVVGAHVDGLRVDITTARDDDGLAARTTLVIELDTPVTATVVSDTSVTATVVRVDAHPSAKVRAAVDAAVASARTSLARTLPGADEARLRLTMAGSKATLAVAAPLFDLSLAVDVVGPIVALARLFDGSTQREGPYR